MTKLAGARLGAARTRAGSVRGDSPATSLREQAYQAIKERILALELKPGQFLNELTLCEMLGMGRMPVHQAVHRLMADGLLEIIPRRGIVIRPDSLNEILTLLEARGAVEPNIAALAAERATRDQIATLQRLLRESARLVDQRHRGAFMAVDRAFHQAVAEAAGNVILVDAQRPLHERSVVIWHVRRFVSDGLRRTQQEHEAVFAAIKRKDPEAARAAMQAHLDGLGKRLVQASDQ
jgi:DNA-binding GntR family transcriptional regulator